MRHAFCSQLVLERGLKVFFLLISAKVECTAHSKASWRAMVLQWQVASSPMRRTLNSDPEDVEKGWKPHDFVIVLLFPAFEPGSASSSGVCIDYHLAGPDRRLVAAMARRQPIFAGLLNSFFRNPNRWRHSGRRFRSSRSRMSHHCF